MFLRNALLVILILVLGACTATPPPAHPTSSDAIERALLSSISLYARSGRRVCAGQRVSSTEVLTAYHCAVAAVLSPAALDALEEAGIDMNDVDEDVIIGASVKFATYTTVLNKLDNRERGKFVRVNRLADLAVMTTERSDQPTVTVRNGHLPVGAEVFAIGHPAGLDYSYTHGYIASTCRTLSFSGDLCWTQVDMTVWGGSSGGGLYDLAGNLVGVTSMMGRPGQAFFANPDAVSKIVHSPVSK